MISLSKTSWTSFNCCSERLSYCSAEALSELTLIVASVCYVFGLSCPWNHLNSFPESSSVAFVLAARLSVLLQINLPKCRVFPGCFKRAQAVTLPVVCVVWEGEGGWRSLWEHTITFRAKTSSSLALKPCARKRYEIFFLTFWGIWCIFHVLLGRKETSSLLGSCREFKRHYCVFVLTLAEPGTST